LIGREFLTPHQGDAGLKAIPTVILTTSEAEADIVKAINSRRTATSASPRNWTRFESLVKSIMISG